MDVASIRENRLRTLRFRTKEQKEFVCNLFCKKRRKFLPSSPSKRQKTSGRSKDLSSTASSTHNFDTLPPEVLESILKCLPYSELAKNVRLVSKRFSNIATSILNCKFLALGRQIRSTISRLHSEIDNPTSNGTPTLLKKQVLGSVEILQAMYEWLRVVTWRYTHPPLSHKFHRLCFYGGTLLDELVKLLEQADKTSASLVEPSGPTNCVSKFVIECKKFMDYFEKVSERRINSRNTLVSGCKVIDLLDCLIDGRELLYYRVSTRKSQLGESSIVNMKIRYVLKRAWFTCLNVPCDSDNVFWRDQQRFMYLRLRRLICSINEHHLEKVRYDREMAEENLDSVRAMKLRIPSTYSGFGEYAGQFFYYGNMNQWAYDNKFKISHSIIREDVNIEENDGRRPIPVSKSNYDLIVTAKVRCSSELAPLALRSMLKCDDFDSLTGTTNNPELFIKLSFDCPASVANRLPGNFSWKIQSPRT